MNSNLKITSEGTIAKTHIMIGDQELRVTKMNIDFDRDGWVRVELEIPAPLLDIEALQKNTELKIVGLGE